VIDWSAFVLPAEKSLHGWRIEMGRPSVRKRVLRSCSIGRSRNIEDAFILAHGGKVWAATDLHTTVHLDHQELNRGPQARCEVFFGKRPTRRVPFAAPRQGIPSTEAFFSNKTRFLVRTALQPRQQAIAVHACRRMPHDEANHTVLKHMTEHLRG
jgi:hypothetical protein